MTDGNQCPRCGEAVVIHGTFQTQGLRFGFRPQELRLFTLSLQFPEVSAPREAAACALCGLVWTELDAAALRQKLQALGNEQVRQCLGLLDGG